MNWIELLFGIAPDGGNGTTEWLYAVASISAAAALVYCRRFRGNVPR